MADELIDICDENNNIVGRGMKSEALAKGMWHRTARIFIYTPKGEILIQLRAKDKELYPGKWDVGAAGHVGAGESYGQTALREAEEELGIRVKKEELDLLMIEKCQTGWNGIEENIFAATYLARFDGDESKIKIQAAEVQGFRFVDVNELEGEIKLSLGKFVPHTEKYWQLLIGSVRKLTGK